VRAVSHERRQIRHAAENVRLLDRGQQLLHGEAVVPAMAVGVFAPAGRNHAEDELADERSAFRAVGPAVLQHKIDPLLQQRRNRVPEERVLQNQDFVLLEQGLFPLHINVEIRVRLVKVVKGGAGEILDCRRQTLVDAGLLESGMSEDYEDALHSNSGF
jgi:hypothetical protein